MNADDFLLSPEELRLRRQKRRRLIIRYVAIGLLVVALVALARPTGRAIKGWQARRHAEKASRLMDADKWEEAQKEVTAAMQLRRTEPAAVRAVAHFLTLTRQPGALEFWKQLSEMRPLNRDELREEATAAFAAGNLSIAEAAVNKLVGERQKSSPKAADWLLAAQLATEHNAADQVRADLEKALADPAGTERQRVQISIMQIALAGNAETPEAEKLRGEAWARIETISQGKSAVALDALVALAQRALGQMSEGGGRKSDAKAGGTTAVSSSSGKNADGTAPVPPIANNTEPITTSIASALEAHPLAKLPQKLLAIDLLIASAPEKKDELIEGTITRWKGADNDALASLAKWLNGKGAFERELSAIPRDRALQSRDLFLQHVDALGALGRWDEIKRLLTSERFPLDATIAQMYLARCNAQLGEKTASENNWQRALESAGGDVQKLMTLGDYAEKNGATGVAAQAFESVTAANPKMRLAWQGRLQIAQVARDTEAIHAVLAEMLEIWPQDSPLQNDEAYTRLLLAGAKDEGRRMKDETRNAEGGARNGGTTAVSSESANQLSDVSSQLSLLEARKPQVESGKSKVDSGSVIAESEKAPPSDLRSLTSDLQALERTAQQLVLRAPASLPHRTLLALVYLKENRPATALGVYENLNIPPGALTPSALAVHAAVLAANGNTADATKEAAQIPRGSLLPEEAELLKTLKN